MFGNITNLLFNAKLGQCGSLGAALLTEHLTTGAAVVLPLYHRKEDAASETAFKYNM